MLTRMLMLVLLLLGSTVVAGCTALWWPADGPHTSSPGAGADEVRFPDVIAVELRPVGDRMFDVAVTMSSPYDTPQRYADGWRVMDADGNVLGTHTLLHDHAAEQPFTRTQRGLHIPAGIDEVTIEGRDQRYGFGGATVTVPVPR